MGTIPINETGHRLNSFNATVSGDGRHVIIVLDVIDRDTKEPMEQFRCFTSYQGLSMLIAKFIEAARTSVEKLIASGVSKELTEPLREVSVFHFASGAVGLSTDKTTVSLEIQTAEGPLLAFAFDPQSAQKIGESLTSTVKQVKPKSSLN
jgi:hypothetical protein